MALKTAKKEYIDSLSKLKLNLYLFGEKVDNWVDNPIIRPSINAIAMTYKLAHEPESEGWRSPESMITGKKVNRFNSLFRGPQDMVSKVKLQRLLGQRTACCFQRCVGTHADGRRLQYHLRDRPEVRHPLPRALSQLDEVRAGQRPVPGAMTDAKGHRGLAPSQQADPDMYVHIVPRDKEGIVIRGAKAHPDLRRQFPRDAHHAHAQA